MKFVLSTFGCPAEDLLALAPVADQCGWEAISFSDHIVHLEEINTPYPYTEDGSRRWQAFTDWPDPFVMIGAMAAVTERIRFTHNLFVLPIRNPFMVAKTVGTAAAVSGNRITLALGLGWSKDEFELMGQDFHTRGKRADEMVEVMRKLWSGEMVEHEGPHYRFPRLEMNPAPGEPIPIWVGGISDPALRRSARLADGWVSDLQTAEEIVACVERVRAYRRQYGRGTDFAVMATPSDAFGRDDWLRLEQRGVTHILMAPWVVYHGEQSTLTQKQDSIRRFAEEFIGPST